MMDLMVSQEKLEHLEKEAPLVLEALLDLLVQLVRLVKQELGESLVQMALLGLKDILEIWEKGAQLALREQMVTLEFLVQLVWLD